MSMQSSREMAAEAEELSDELAFLSTIVQGPGYHASTKDRAVLQRAARVLRITAESMKESNGTENHPRST